MPVTPYQIIEFLNLSFREAIFRTILKHGSAVTAYPVLLQRVYAFDRYRGVEKPGKPERDYRSYNYCHGFPLIQELS
jgi:hypothetical protein